jgi:hypothetical protein
LKVTTGTSDGLALQQKISNLMNGEAIEKMGRLFDDLVSSEEWLIMDRIDIQLGDITADELESGFADLVIRKLKEKIEDRKAQIMTGAVKGTGSASLMSLQEKTLQAFIVFIEKGMFPWWYEVRSHAEYEDEISDALQKFHTLSLTRPGDYYLNEMKRILSYKYAAERFTGQFSDKVFEQLLEFLSSQPGLAPPLHSALTAMSRISTFLSGLANRPLSGNIIPDALTKIKALLIHKLALAMPNEEFAGSWLSDVVQLLSADDMIPIRDEALNDMELKELFSGKRTILSDGTGKRLITAKSRAEMEPHYLKQEQQSDIKKEIESLEGVMVSNAGLVIVTPFLPELFNECRILEGKNITDPDMAVAILHLIVWGNIDYREYDAVLSKVLCNIGSEHNLKLISRLEPDVYSKVEEMLEATVRNWGSLKDTSPEGLRESFLRRKGKLIFSNDNWFLHVEQNTIDILLQSLPWNIGFIRLPWMKTMLRTEWI